MVTEKRISRMKRTFFIDNAQIMLVLSLFDVLYNWKSIFLIKHVNFKLPYLWNKDNNWE